MNACKFPLVVRPERSRKWAALLVWIAVFSSAATALGALVYEDSPALRIPAEGTGPAPPVVAAIFVPAHAFVESVAVTVWIEHTDISDLRISLASPTGVTVPLKSEWVPLWRENRPDMWQTTLADDAPAPLIDGPPPYTGDYQPEGALAALRGQLAQGIWRLAIEDVYAGDSGILHRWSLSLTKHTVPEPASGLILALLGVLLSRRRFGG